MRGELLERDCHTVLPYLAACWRGASMPSSTFDGDVGSELKRILAACFIALAMAVQPTLHPPNENLLSDQRAYAAFFR
jgi:hypothetical protein